MGGQDGGLALGQSQCRVGGAGPGWAQKQGADPGRAQRRMWRARLRVAQGLGQVLVKPRLEAEGRWEPQLEAAQRGVEVEPRAMVLSRPQGPPTQVGVADVGDLDGRAELGWPVSPGAEAEAEVEAEAVVWTGQRMVRAEPERLAEMKSMRAVPEGHAWFWQRRCQWPRRVVGSRPGHTVLIVSNGSRRDQGTICSSSCSTGAGPGRR